MRRQITDHTNHRGSTTAASDSTGRCQRIWLTYAKHGLMLCCDWFKYMTIPQSFATAKNRSSSPTKVRHIGWQLADAREYLSTSVASTVSRRIYIYIYSVSHKKSPPCSFLKFYPNWLGIFNQFF